MANMPSIPTIINGVFPPLYPNSKTKHGISTSIRLARKACDESSPPPAGRSLGWMNLYPPPPETLFGTWVADIFPSDYDAKGHTVLERPARRQIAWAYAI
ncbi:hypothetical protein V8E54_010555 [Elaphomyces granulatus]